MTRVATLLSTAPAATMLPAEDLQRASSFYEEKLGFSIERRDDMPDTVLVHAGNGTVIGLYEHSRTKADHTAVTFEVDEFDATVSDLRSHGIRFEEYDFPGLKTVNGIAVRGSEKAAWFTDPEGNILCVHSSAA